MPQASRTIAPLSNGARPTRRRDHRLQELVEGEFELLVDFESDDEKDEIVRICERKIDEWNRREAPRARTASRDVKVFERARWRCELCGMPATVRPLQIDHIVPRSKRDRTDHVMLHGKRIHYENLENLQALCGPCNQGKSNTRSEDYRPSKNWMAETIAYTMRLAKFYEFDAHEVLRMANQESTPIRTCRATDNEQSTNCSQRNLHVGPCGAPRGGEGSPAPARVVGGGRVGSGCGRVGFGVVVLVLGAVIWGWNRVLASEWVGCGVVVPEGWMGTVSAYDRFVVNVSVGAALGQTFAPLPLADRLRS